MEIQQRVFKCGREKEFFAGLVEESSLRSGQGGSIELVAPGKCHRVLLQVLFSGKSQRYI